MGKKSWFNLLKLALIAGCIYFIAVIMFLSCSKDDISQVKSVAQTNLIDIDGNKYHIVTIGTQVWMAENLKLTHYRNGDPIPNVIEDNGWANLTTGA